MQIINIGQTYKHKWSIRMITFDNLTGFSQVTFKISLIYLNILMMFTESSK